MVGPPDNDKLATARDELILEITAQVERLGTGDGNFALDPKVLAAMRLVPREKFVPMMEQAEAYANTPLPIGHRQTISQPLIVALMTHHLRVESENHILEIGTGSGYQTAVLAELAHDIVTIENVAELARSAKATLGELGYSSIRLIDGDGRLGSPKNAPFDRIIITAAAETMPEALIEQLAPDGRLVAPIGRKGRQEMTLLQKSADDEIRKQILFPCAFVPLI